MPSVSLQTNLWKVLHNLTQVHPLNRQWIHIIRVLLHQRLQFLYHGPDPLYEWGVFIAFLDIDGGQLELAY